MSYDTHDVVQVLETSSVEEVNELCKLGWVVLSVAKGQYEHGAAYHLYCLGWKQQDQRPVVPTKFNYAVRL